MTREHKIKLLNQMDDNTLLKCFEDYIKMFNPDDADIVESYELTRTEILKKMSK